MREDLLIINENTEKSLKEEFSAFYSAINASRSVFLNIPVEVLNGPVSKTCLAVLEFLAWIGTKVDEQTGKIVVRPVMVSHAFLSQLFGVSRQWIIKITHRLEKLGYLKIKKKKNLPGRLNANIYIISEDILNKEFLKTAKSGLSKKETTELRECRKIFEEYLRSIYFQVREGKISLENFVKDIFELFEVNYPVYKEKNQN